MSTDLELVIERASVETFQTNWSDWFERCLATGNNGALIALLKHSSTMPAVSHELALRLSKLSTKWLSADDLRLTNSAMLYYPAACSYNSFAPTLLGRLGSLPTGDGNVDPVLWDCISRLPTLAHKAKQVAAWKFQFETLLSVCHEEFMVDLHTPDMECRLTAPLTEDNVIRPLLNAFCELHTDHTLNRIRRSRIVFLLLRKMLQRDAFSTSAVCVPVTQVFNLIACALSISLNESVPLEDRLALVSLKQAAVSLASTTLQTARIACLPSCSMLTTVLLEVLHGTKATEGASKQQRNKDSALHPSLLELRCCVYDCFSAMADSLASACGLGEDASKLYAYLVADLQPQKVVLAKGAAAGLALLDVSAGKVGKGKRRNRKRKSETMESSALILAVGDKTRCLAEKRSLVLSAAACATTLVSTCSLVLETTFYARLQSFVVKLLVQLQNQPQPSEEFVLQPYATHADCRAALLELLECMLLHPPPSWGPAIQPAVGIFTAALGDASMQVRRIARRATAVCNSLSKPQVSALDCVLVCDRSKLTDDVTLEVVNEDEGNNDQNNSTISRTDGTTAAEFMDLHEVSTPHSVQSIEILDEDEEPCSSNAVVLKQTETTAETAKMKVQTAVEEEQDEIEIIDELPYQMTSASTSKKASAMFAEEDIQILEVNDSETAAVITHVDDEIAVERAKVAPMNMKGEMVHTEKIELSSDVRSMLDDFLE